MQKILGREPTLIIAALNALVMIIGSVGLGLFTQDQAGLAVVVINAAFGAVNAITTRPISPSVFTYLIASVLALLSSYGLELSPQLVVSINAAVVPLLALIFRGQVSPVETPVTQPSLDPTPEAAEKEAKDGHR